SLRREPGAHGRGGGKPDGADTARVAACPARAEPSLTRPDADTDAGAARASDARGSQAAPGPVAEAKPAAPNRRAATRWGEGASSPCSRREQGRSGQPGRDGAAGREPSGVRGAARSSDWLANGRGRANTHRLRLPVRLVPQTGDGKNRGSMAASEPVERAE